MKKIAAIMAFIFALAFAFLGPVVGQGPGGGAAAAPDHIILTWTGDPSTTMTVTWRTDRSVTSGFAQYQPGPKLSTNARLTGAVARDFPTDLGTVRLFTATLTGLSSGTKYSYRVGDGKSWSDIHAFSTGVRNVPSFKFLIFGDSQSSLADPQPYGLWHETVQNAYKANADAKFMMNVGDLVDYGQSGQHWNAWFAAALGVVDTIPEMAVLGNHECYGSAGQSKPFYWITQLPLPQNGPESLKNQVYSFNYGPVHFVVLDSQQDEEKQSGDILESQKVWLDDDLAASKSAWKMVFFHKPPYELAMRKNEEVKAAFCPILEKHRVDLVFNAHDHGIGRTYPVRDGAFMQKPSQGTIYYVVGRSGGKTYPRIEKKAWDTFFYNPQDQPNYLTVVVEGPKITIETVKQDGTLIDTFLIDKTKDTSSDSKVPSAPLR